MKKILIICLLALVSAIVYRQVQDERAATSAVDGDIILYGNVDIRDVSLGFRVAGRISEMRFEEGDRVAKNQLLAVLDKQPFLDDVEVNDALLAEAKIVRNKVEKPYLRRERLSRTGAISAEERDDAKAERDEAAAKVLSAKARLQQARTRLADTEILSPSNGIILTRVREPGGVVAAGESVYTLALDSPVWIRAYIDEPRLGHIHPGQEAEVRTDSGRVYSGHVGFISPQAEFTPKTVETVALRADLVYRLRIIVAVPDAGLRQGMPVTVTLKRAVVENAE